MKYGKEKKDNVDDPSGGMLRAFTNRNYTRLWFSNCLSYIARWMQVTLLAWLILELTDSPWYVALVGFFFMFPTLGFGLVGGILADEMERQRLLVISQGISAVVSIWLTWLLVGGTVHVWQAYLTALINGASWAISFPSRRALIYDLCGASGVTNAVALDTVGMNISRILGPALGGVLITLTGVGGGYSAVTLSYAIGLILLWPMRAGRFLKRGQPRRSVFQNLIEGFRYVRRTPSILAVVWITVAVNFFLFSYPPMVSVVARDVLHVGPALMGILQAAEGFGALVGAMIIAASTSIRYHGRIFLYGSMLAFAALCVFSISRSYLFSFNTLLGLGLGTSAFATMQGAFVMLVAKEDMRGRALGVVSFAIGVGHLGSLLLGVTANTFGPMVALRMNSLAGILALTGIAFFLPAIHSRTIGGTH